eukprot:20255-Heterococcus_DN1.PRE.2
MHATILQCTGSAWPSAAAGRAMASTESLCNLIARPCTQNLQNSEHNAKCVLKRQQCGVDKASLCARAHALVPLHHAVAEGL